MFLLAIFASLSMNIFWFLGVTIIVATSIDDLKKIIFKARALWPHSALSHDALLEHPTAEMLASLSPIIANEYAQLAQRDSHNAQFVPSWSNMNETTPLGVLELGDLVRTDRDYTSFRIRNYPGFVIKYMHDCIGGPFAVTPHPLAREVWLQNEAAKINITDEVLFLSPAVAMPSSRVSLKIHFNISDDEFTECHFAGGTVRYVVKWIPSGVSINRLLFPPTRTFSISRFNFAMTVGANLMLLLKNLHAQGLVHGNLVSDNILVHYAQNETISLELHNFYFAQPIAGRQLLPVRSGRLWNQSPWEMTELDHRYNTQDEIFRAVRIVAQLMNPIEYLRRQMDLNATALALWNKAGNIFVPPEFFDDSHPNPNPLDYLPLPHRVRENIKTRLRMILFYSRSFATPYDIIIRAFTDLGRLAETTTASRRGS